MPRPVVTCLVVLLSPSVHFWFLFWPLTFLAVAPISRQARRAAVVTTGVLGLLARYDLSRRLPDGRLAIVLGVAVALLSGVGVPRRSRRDVSV